MNTALLALRLIVGLGFAAHGSQKLFGWFGGYGISGTGAFFESIGFRPGKRFALAAGSGEFLGGLLLALGFLGPIGPALMVSVMLVAILTVHRGHGFFAEKNGAEMAILYISGAFLVAVVGPGQYSVDEILGLDSTFPHIFTWIALGCGTLGALGAIALRREPGLEPKSS